VTPPPEPVESPPPTLAEPVEGPHDWARSWLPDNDDPARPLMTLATIDVGGAPSARTVLLSEVTATGFAFHTDSRSHKAAELAADPRVCLTVVLPEDSHQIVVQGVASPQEPSVSRAAYGRRSAYLRHLAWLNDAELARLGDEERLARWTEAVAGAPDGPTDPPPTWMGFEVVPTRYVFWEGGTELASRRTEFRRTRDGWEIDHLPG
jgi:pyridoxamine 5'-phosphate oxidase